MQVASALASNYSPPLAWVVWQAICLTPRRDARVPPIGERRKAPVGVDHIIWAVVPTTEIGVAFAIAGNDTVGIESALWDPCVFTTPLDTIGSPAIPGLDLVAHATARVGQSFRAWRWRRSWRICWRGRRGSWGARHCLVYAELSVRTWETCSTRGRTPMASTCPLTADHCETPRAVTPRARLVARVAESCARCLAIRLRDVLQTVHVASTCIWR